MRTNPGRKTIGDAHFDERLESLVRITFEIGGFFGGTERRTLTFDGEQIVVEREGFNEFMPEMDTAEHYVSYISYYSQINGSEE